MTREDIVKQVNKVLAEEFETEESKMTPDANLKDALNLDSLSLVDLVAVIQYTYKPEGACGGSPQDQHLR